MLVLITISISSLVGCMQEKYSNAFLAAGPEEKNFALELTYNYGKDSYNIGSGFGHFALRVEDVYKTVDSIKSAGGRLLTAPALLSYSGAAPPCRRQFPQCQCRQ